MIQTRSERSRNAILRSFAELLFRQGYDDVSVRDIVAGAAVARSTFYEHFSSKEDVLCTSMGRFFEVLARCVSEEDQPTGLINVLAHFWANRRLTDAIFSGTPRKIIALSLSEMVEARLRERSSDKLLLPHRLASIQIGEAQLALVEGWLRGRAPAPVNDVAAALHGSSRALAAAITRMSLLETNGSAQTR